MEMVENYSDLQILCDRQGETGCLNMSCKAEIYCTVQ